MLRKPIHHIPFLLLILLLLTTLAACSPNDAAAPAADGRLQVVATTSIIGDVVNNIGGDDIHLTVLIPAGSDPHSFEPSPQQIAALADADIVFVNGFGLEQTLMPMLESAVAPDKIVAVSEGVDPLVFAGDEADHEGEEGMRYDPHTWMDPNNVIIWTENIERALSEADPEHADAYHARAEAYRQQLRELDAWIKAQIEPLLPLKVVTDHKVFGYFARRYGIEQVGAIIPAYSAMAQPSAQELAQLEDAIRQLGVDAVLVGNTVNPQLAKQVAEDTGIKLIPIYTGSLSGPDGPAPTYIDLMRYNVHAILQAAQ
jgi:ABC-type Zn uptake system ZnuABC Zn-binding protein ZnuA